ncbi:hypothetical protein [Cellulomonas bogoriensis]|uniref:Uncharacterized protein n=1 Tax=Cellulomonas bogoriensis 69B4 = DSM 16987 TaxID=1386082 RepID=A0A0A0BZ24_9CELL|nr:hypothetical protein [Cellulomonas bogoriensis]KGM13648.1 hypothetical protein N869_07420 [Cellulomonas bogoriensis 69B4 = DSM 16987]
MALTVMVSGCSSEPAGRFEDGAAQFTVTYRPGPGAAPVSVDVQMDGTDCHVSGGTTSFGEDVAPSARAEHMETAAEDLHAPIGYYAGAVSGMVDTDRTGLSIVLPDGYLFVSRRDFAMADGAFEVTDHVGWVTTGGVHSASLVTDDQAQATGSFTCGSVGGRAD